MSMKILDKAGLEHFWTKLKVYFAPKAHTHNAFETKHSYTVATNAAKNWYRIANANTSQLDTTKPIRAQFIVTAYNTSYAADYYETWFVNAIVFGRQAHIVIFGGSGAPFSQARILYENTVADIDANDRPAIDLYLNYVLPNGTTKIEVEEIYNNGGWTFVADGQLAISTVPSGFENVTTAPCYSGVNYSTYASYVNYLNRQISNFTAAFTLADSYLYRSRTLNCTGTFTITIPSINSGYMWCVIKNKNTSSGVITLHPSTTSVLIDGSNADITLQPMEYVCIHSAGANNYSLITDGRFSIKTVASAKSVSTENPSTHTKLFYTVGQPAVGTTAGKAYEGSSSDYSLLSFPANGTVHNTNANIQNLRLMWLNSTAYFTDIFVSPNNHYIWHRDVMYNNAYGWRRLVEENVTGITAPTWDISIGGNAATASAVAWSGITGKPTTIAGYGITDAKIANGTITLGSNSITPLTSVPSHNQASNTINAMTGYSKPSSTSAIASTDSLNTAVGKLEKEDEYLHDEFLLVKGVADNCYAVATAHQQLIEDLQDDVDAKASATHTHGSITNDGKLGTASRVVVTDGNKAIAVSSVTATELGYLSGVTSAVQTQLNAKVADSAVVHLAGAETVTGDKIFSGELIRKETASGTAAFFNSHRETATGAWSCGIGVGGTGKGGFYDWTRGKYFFSRALTTGDIEIIAYPDSGSPAKSFILKSDGTATWNGQAIQTSSDERLKTPLAAVPDEVLDAWGDVGWGQFQFLSAIDCKGESARLHLGLIAQRVKSAFEARGLDACAYGILCHDERPEREVTGEDGRPTIEEAVDLWTVRYAEALAMEAAYQRRRADRLEARIAALEVKIDA